MIKRKRNVADESKAVNLPIKRLRYLGKDNFESLSDELVLRIISFLPVVDTTKVEQVSQRFRRLASDNEIWREKFFNDFVRPRARRIPGVEDKADIRNAKRSLYYASKNAKWLEHSTRSPAEKDWKRRYKIKLNWTRGRCRTHEMTLDCPLKPRLLIKMSHGIIVTASNTGLRSYSQRSRPQILYTYYWETRDQYPTALSVHTHDRTTTAIVGFSDGTFEVFVVDTSGEFTPKFVYTSTHKHGISNLAISWPYVLTMSAKQELTLYRLVEGDTITNWACIALAHLHSDAAFSPVSLAIHKASATLTASIAYSFCRLNTGWCLGLQEIRLSLNGDVVDSRLTSTIDTPLTDFPLKAPKIISRSTSTGPLPLHPHLMHPPNTLSHSGCYILAGLPDNTLMVYTVISSLDKLEISGGRRLWGHTSAVSGIELSPRGKALSISSKSDEIRVWELEEILSSYSLSKTSTALKPWPKADDIGTALLKRGNGLGLAVQEMKHELEWTKHWVGFDDEQVVVLGERDQKQILSCYDFA